MLKDGKSKDFAYARNTESGCKLKQRPSLKFGLWLLKLATLVFKACALTHINMFSRGALLDENL